MDTTVVTSTKARALLDINTICVLSTLMPDGSPHGSAAHFATSVDGLRLYISLHRSSHTAQNLALDTRAALTVGAAPQIPATLQMRGRLTPVEADHLAAAQEAFYARFPHSVRFRDDPSTVFAGFTPTWARYLDAQTYPQFFVRGFPPDNLF